jgi:hypothetical protein
MTRKKLFISYSHRDVRWFERVREQLAVLEQEGLIDPFEDTRIGAGEDWYARLDQEMLEAQIALLLISASFLTSAFIRRKEIPQLFGQHEAEGMVLYPLLVRDCPWQEVSWLARLQMRPRDARPIASMGTATLDKCLADVAREIASIVRAGSTVKTPPQSAPTIGALHEQRTGEPPTGPFGTDEFSDKDVNDVVLHLRRLHKGKRTEFLDEPDLLPELDLLFNRKTFRFEELRRCPEQRWADRLDSAYQTLKVLQGYVRNVRGTMPAKYSTYRDLVMAVDKYCMQMGALLFESGVDYNQIEEHVGKSTFKAHLPNEENVYSGRILIEENLLRRPNLGRKENSGTKRSIGWLLRD